MAKTTSTHIDELFGEGKDVLPYADESTFERPAQRQRRVSLDLNAAMVERLDGYADEYGVTRQSLIKVWLAERLDTEDDRKARRVKA